jgi:hypothetical protein
LIGRLIRKARRGLVFRRALSRLLADPEACASPSNPVLADLVRGWGNDWSAREDYLSACIGHMLVTDGPVLECGSGLTTVVLGLLAQRRDIAYWALEDSPHWVARMTGTLARHGLDDVVLCEAPLIAFDGFSWYAAPLARMPKSFRLVICDGPPGSTSGGRYGLVPVLGTRLAASCVVLLDDAGRSAEREIAAYWCGELGAAMVVLGRVKPFIEMTLPAWPARLELPWSLAASLR